MILHEVRSKTNRKNVLRVSIISIKTLRLVWEEVQTTQFIKEILEKEKYKFRPLMIAQGLSGKLAKEI